VAGEQVVVVPSLSLPAGTVPTAKAAMGSEAVRLFVERAQLALPGFTLDDRDAAAVAEICRRLDGIPLAIELAAARVRVLGVNEIRAKLDDRFRLLTAGGATPVGRHQTLLAAIQWSYDHLGEPEARLFRGLAAFAGGWSLGTATAVCMESGDEFEVLDLLTQLVHKSLVVVERLRDGTSRYRMLETVREYARQRLDAAPEAVRLRGRHLDYFLALAEAAERKLLGPEEARWLADLELELENLLVAFATSERVEGGGEIGLRLAGSIWRFWSTRGHFETGRRVLKDALRREGARAPTPWRAQALVRAGGLATYQGDYAAARPLVEEALEVYRTLSDEKGIARALSGLGTIALYQDDYASARAHNEEGLALYERLGQRRGVAVCLYNLGFLELCQDRLAEARAPLERSLELMREVGDRGTVAQALSVLGLLAARAGDVIRARAMLLEGLHGARELGAKAESVYLLEAAAELAWAIGEVDRAAEWIGAAQAARRSLNIPMVPAEERQRQAFLARLGESRPGVGRSESAEAPAEGLEEALIAAVSWLEGLTPATRS
jgi:non-specific serine/threonine protein kinase